MNNNVHTHTQGPWFQFDNGGTVSSLGHVYGEQFADVVWGPKGPGHGSICDCSPHGGKATQETIANAKLISAAPDMLKTLENCMDYFKKRNLGCGAVALLENITSVVSQAKGE